MQHRKEPGAAHHALMTELNGVVKRFDDNGMPVVERIAVLAQVIGRQILLVEPGAYTPAELLQSVAANITAGNQAAQGSGLITAVPS